MHTLAPLQSLVALGESETLEFKRTTAELRRVGETLCAFLNGDGGRVLIGVESNDRIEIRSIGGFPSGVRAEHLSTEHLSVRRNPLIAEAFHRTGAIESWGRGTNCVIDACRAYGIAAPTFTVDGGAVTVRFAVEVVSTSADLVPGRHQVGTKSALSPSQVEVLALAAVPRTLAELIEPFGRTDRTKFRDQVLRPLLKAELLEMTIPDKPNSSKQQDRITDRGKRVLEAE